MNNRELATAVKNVLDKIHQGEKLALPLLAAKARKYVKANPTDVSAITASQVLTKMAENRTFIPRSEFNSLINGLHTSQTKLNQVFAEEMQQQLQSGPTTFDRAKDEGTPLESDYEKVADPVLANALSNIFEKDGPIKLYSEAHANKACKACHAGLLATGMEPRKVETFAGQDDIILCAATYETPKGDTRVLVPIEIKEGMALLPTMFISQAGFTDLTTEAVYQHIRATGGKSLRINAQEALKTLHLAKNGMKKVASDVELAIIQMKSAKGSPAHDPNSIVAIHVDEPEADIDVSVPQTTEEISFSQRMAKADGVAGFVHGERVVEAGRSMLERKMTQFGHRGAQISVADSDTNRIIYAVAIGNHIGFKVPVKVNANMVIPPTVLISNGELKSFSANGVNNLVKNSKTDTRALAQSSRNYHLRPSQLVEMVRESCAEGNFSKAEDCINVLGEIDQHAQQVAIANMMIAITNEVGKDNHMENMEKAANQPVNDTPYFMTHKVFFPDGV